ncbi:MAG: thioredoxin family protein [Patescibacteria group bacterium]|nr:thioredoxin family protein [Patescibacteria group bacterium]
MRKDWALISIIALILVVGLGLVGYLKLSKKKVIANPLPSNGNQQVAGATSSQPFFAEDAKVSFFYSDYCHWCQKEESEVLTPLAQEGYKVKPMNIGEKPEYGQQFNVTGTPTFIASNGDRLVGFQTKDVLKAWLDQHK